MKKISDFLLKLFNVFFCLTILYILKLAIFDSNIFKILDSRVVIIVTIVMLIIIISCAFLFKRLKDKYLMIITIICFTLLILIQLFFAKNFAVYPGWDFGMVFNEGVKMANHGINFGQYFYEQYPNNIGAALLMGIIFKICNIVSSSNYIYGLAAILVNIFLINLAVIVLYIFIKKLYGIRISTLFAVFILLISPLYAYVPIVYTDTLTMIFPILTFYLYYLYINSGVKYKYLYLVGLGIIVAIGTILKTNIIIGLVALIIYIIFTSGTLKRISKRVSLIGSSFIIIMILNNYLVSALIPIPLEEAGYPPTHWIMMGLSIKGGYNPHDIEFTESFKTKEERKTANIKEIKRRLEEFGVKGYLKFLNTKLIYTWSDGTLYSPEKLRRDPVHYTKYHDYIIGDKNSEFLYLSQGSYILMMIFILIGAISMFKSKDKLIYLCNICIFGVFLFLIIWETRSRYIVCFLPVFLLSASRGLNYLLGLFGYNNDKIKINCK